MHNDKPDWTSEGVAFLVLSGLFVFIDAS